MSQTSLNFLMRDGAVTVTFEPALTAEQYAELHELVRQASTVAELRPLLEGAAREWHVACAIDDC